MLPQHGGTKQTICSFVPRSYTTPRKSPKDTWGPSASSKEQAKTPRDCPRTHPGTLWSSTRFTRRSQEPQETCRCSVRAHEGRQGDVRRNPKNLLQTTKEQARTPTHNQKTRRAPASSAPRPPLEALGPPDWTPKASKGPPGASKCLSARRWDTSQAAQHQHKAPRGRPEDDQGQPKTQQMTP